MQVRDPLEELHETKLWQYLNSINPEYAGISSHFLKLISPILSTIKEIFPFFTRHDAHHGFRVLSRIQKIVDKNCFDVRSELAFSADEAFLLVCSSYAHDLGMAVFPNEREALLQKLKINSDANWQESAVLQDFLRANHSSRGGFYISENCELLKIPRNLIFLLHKMMEAHNLSINELDAQLGKRFAAGELEIDLRQLACILCIADSVEFSETRVVEGVLENLKEKMSEARYSPSIAVSYQHNMQSACIRDGVAVADDGKIIFTGTFSDPEVLSLAHNTIDLIETWLRNYIDIDFRSKKKRLIVRGDSIVRELSILGVDFERIGIRMRKEHIIDLIASNATWTMDSAIVVRELMQNSVEACRFRSFHSSIANNYKPKIDLFLDHDKRTIVLVDNGCGMSRNIILNHFLTVANSRSSDPAYSTDKYASLARFGIGFWSVFTIAQKALVETAPFEYMVLGQEPVDGVSFEVSIEEFKDYTVFKPVKRTPGTTITLYLKDTINLQDVLYRLNYHIGCSTIPIQIHSSTTDSYYLPNRINLPTLKEAFGPKIAYVNQYEIKEYHFETITDNIDIGIKIFYRIQDGQASFRLPDNRTGIMGLQDTISVTMYRGAGICGFLFNHHPRKTVIDFFRIGYFSANTLDPKGYQFTLNRLGLLDSPAYAHYNIVLSKEIHNCYRQFLQEMNCIDAENIVRLNQQTRSNGGENPGTFTGNALKTFSVQIPDLIAFKLYKIQADKTITTCEIEYLFYQELVAFRKNLYLHSTPIYQIGFRISEMSHAVLYEQIKLAFPIDTETYLLECTAEADMLADNARDCIIYTEIKNLNPFAIFPVRNFNSNSVDPSLGGPKVIADVRGVWSGTIVEGNVSGSNFAVLSQHYLIVKKGSLLADEIRSLYSAGLAHKICQIAHLLQEANLGFIDDSVRKYF